MPIPYYQLVLNDKFPEGSMGVTMSWSEGFEDAIELCLAELQKAETKEKAETKLEQILGLVHNKKFDRIKSMLSML